ncbi:MAG: peptidoglycan DD-metalloendopeptidase family protein [Clostridia bacterium]
MNKKPHMIYALLSICTVILYGTFLIRNAITDTNSQKEDLPYTPPVNIREQAIEEPTQTAINVMEKAENVKHQETPSEAPITEKEEPTEKITEAPTEALRGFSPMLPVEGEIIENFSLTHIYNESTHDWRAHTGIDIKAEATARVLSCEDGTVTACYTDPLWGNVIEISHGEYTSVYKNLSTLIMVKEGDFVHRGEAISGVGQSGAAEGVLSDHLHFELLHYSDYVDPMSFISVS